MNVCAPSRFITAGPATFYLPGPAATSAMTFLFCLVTADLCSLGFSLTDLSTLLFLAGSSVCGVIYAWLRDLDARITSALSALTALCVTVLLSTILQCTFTAHGTKEMFDHTLLATDRMLGLDPISFTAFFDLSPLACCILNVAYMSMGVQMLALLAIYLLRNDYEGIDAFIITLVFLIVIGSVIAAIVPAIGFTGIVDVSFQNTDVSGGRAGQPTFLALRSGALRQIDLAGIHGLITFPSGHAAIAILMMLAARRTPYALFPLTTLNVLMLISTITHGGHYFCDVFAGGVIAALSWTAARKLAARRPPFVSLSSTIFSWRRRVWADAAPDTPKSSDHAARSMG